jgi:uncharacterized membrane protein
MFDTDKLKEIGFWNEELRGIHEYDLALKLAKNGYSIFTVPEVLATKNNIAYLERNNYWIKIAEVMDFWKYYGKYFLHHIHIKGFIFNSIKTIGLLSMYLSGYVLKERIWVVLYPFKRWFSYENSNAVAAL